MRSGRLLVMALLCAMHGGGAEGGVMDNFNDGLKLAGQMFGINTAADVANLVAKAFSKPDLLNALKQPADESDQSLADEPENAQEMPPLQEPEQTTGETTQTRRRPPSLGLGELSTGQMLTNMLRMVGFDVRKLSALAINALVMIAQAIGSSLMQATRGGGHILGMPTPSSEPSDHRPRALRSGTPIDWFLQRSDKQAQGLIYQIMGRELPERIVDMIEQRESAEQGNAACLKLLICKSSPIIWGMQKSLRRRLAANETEPLDVDQQSEGGSYFNSGVFFQHLPSLVEFREYGSECETRFASHCPRNGTQG